MVAPVPLAGRDHDSQEARTMEIGRIVREVEMIPESEPDRTPLEEPAPAYEPAREPVHEPA